MLSRAMSPPSVSAAHSRLPGGSTMSVCGGRDATAAKAMASRWIEDFGTALAQSDCATAAALIHPDGHWRDVLAFTWHLKTFNGVEQIKIALQSTLSATRPTGFRLGLDRTPPRHVQRAGVDA